MGKKLFSPYQRQFKVVRVVLPNSVVIATQADGLPADQQLVHFNRLKLAPQQLQSQSPSATKPVTLGPRTEPVPLRAAPIIPPSVPAVVSRSILRAGRAGETTPQIALPKRVRLPPARFISE